MTISSTWHLPPPTSGIFVRYSYWAWNSTVFDTWVTIAVREIYSLFVWGTSIARGHGVNPWHRRRCLTQSWSLVPRWGVCCYCECVATLGIECMWPWLRDWKCLIWAKMQVLWKEHFHWNFMGRWLCENKLIVDLDCWSWNLCEMCCSVDRDVYFVILVLRSLLNVDLWTVHGYRLSAEFFHSIVEKIFAL